MQTNEAQFIESAKRLIDAYQRKVKRLQSIVADFELEPAQPDLPLLAANGAATREQVLGIPQDKPLEKIAGGRPKNAAQWIRWAVGQIPDRVIAPDLLKLIHAAGPSMLLKSSITSGRISTALYQLVKDGELELINKTPGKASLYHTTTKFVRFEQLKKAKRAKKAIVASAI